MSATSFTGAPGDHVEPARREESVADALGRRVLGLANRGTLHAARLPQAVHDGVAGAVSGSMGLALRSVVGGLNLVGTRGVRSTLDDFRAGRVLLSAVDGLVGDRLPEEQPQLETPVCVRAAGRSVPLETQELATAYPRASGRIVVFVHGSGEREEHWDVRRCEQGGTYGTRLEAHAGWTAVYLRVDTGRPVSENGVALTALMQRLTEAWPVPVRRIALVGHSAGGLIIRAGCSVATDHGDPWTRRLSDVVTLGTRHLEAALDDERGLCELPPMPGVRYRIVPAMEAPRSRVGLILGDLRVRRSPATAARKALRLFPEAEVLHVTDADDATLLNHPDVHRALQGWLA